MYDDNPDWRLFFGLIENMYQEHPVRIDIAGTIESISHITKDLLYECYETFYHPSNMLLFVVGPVDPEAIIRQVRENQQKNRIQTSLKSSGKKLKSLGPYLKEQEIKMNVQSSKCLVGLKALIR